METHRFDVISFIFGALFLAFTASIMWDFNYDWGFDLGAWLLPVAFLIIGLAMLSSGIRTATKKNDNTDSTP
ncbi:MAG: hypothetical protein ABFR95_08575 [Actinomycetota bacterium]